MKQTDDNMTAEEKIVKARCLLLVRLPFYGHLLTFFNTVVGGVRTAAVWINSYGEPMMAFNPKFVDRLNVEQVVTVLRHELEHILNLHHLRAKAFGPSALTNKAVLNWAMDAAIHGHRSNPRLEGIAGDPFFEKHCVFIPEYMQGMLTMETLVENLPHMSFKEFIKLLKEGGIRLKLKTPGTACKDGAMKDDGGEELGSNGQKQEDSSSPPSPPPLPVWMEGQEDLTEEEWDTLIDRLMDHEVWEDSPNEKELERILRILFRKSSKASKMHGSHRYGDTPANHDLTIEIPTLSQIDWRTKLRNYCGRYMGNHRLTYSRRNRRYHVFGVKGISHHASSSIFCMVDVSGSIATKDLQEFFTELECISGCTRIKFITFDYEVKSHQKGMVLDYKPGDWRSIKLRGGGGTSFINAFKWADEHRCWANCNIVLTDGYATFPDTARYKGRPLMWCITSNGIKSAPPFGDCIRITR